MTAAVVSDADRFALMGDGIDVLIGPDLRGTTLRYFSSRDQRVFGPGEITIEQTTIGTWYTVTLTLTVDVGSTTFSVLAPTVRVSGGNSAPVRTVALTTVHKTPFAPPVALGQTETYTVHQLHGVATFVET
jgi:hypothetical protein